MMHFCFLAEKFLILEVIKREKMWQVKVWGHSFAFDLSECFKTSDTILLALALAWGPHQWWQHCLLSEQLALALAWGPQHFVNYLIS